MSSPLADLYHPDRFRALGHQVVELLADALARSERREGPVLPPGRPGELLARHALPAPGSTPLLELLADAVARSTHLHHPGFVGHQVSAPLPEAAVVGLVSELLNNGMAVFEMGPVATAMERVVLRWMSDTLGLGSAAGGVLTSGGSLGTLTALLAARRVKAGFDVWGKGAHAGPPLAILVGEQAHYCVQRAAQIMGLGADGVIAAGVDARYRMDPARLPAALEEARRRGRKVIAVVASAASTATGAYDPLEPIADFCAAHEVWLHVDGAHGAVAALSPRHRHLVQGIHRADSVVWDAHKMLLMPALVTGVLFRSEAHAAATFAQEASYLFHEGNDEAWSDVGQRTVECTKRMLSLQPWMALATHGEQVFVTHVEHTFGLAQALAARLTDSPDFELAVPPQCNIVCFRHLPRGANDVDGLQRQIRQRINEQGDFYLVMTRLDGIQYLRTTLINPLTTEADLDRLVEAVRRAAG